MTSKLLKTSAIASLLAIGAGTAAMAATNTDTYKSMEAFMDVYN